MPALRLPFIKFAVTAAGLLGLGLLGPIIRGAPEYTSVPNPAEPPSAQEDNGSADVGGGDTSVPVDPLPDADALARRMIDHQDIYAMVRDEALAGYAKMHPKPAPYDDEARAALRLLAYLNVWGDYYGEGLWQQYGAHVGHLWNEGANFTVWTTQWRAHQFEKFHSDDEASAAGSTREAIEFDTTPYPALFKFRNFTMTMQNLLLARAYHKINGLESPAFKEVPHLVDLAAQAYTQMIREHMPEDMLFSEGSRFLAATSPDESVLDSVSTALDKAFAAAAPGDPLAMVLKAEFHTEDAWRARGSGYANTVSGHGWMIFHSHIDQANQILAAVYAAHPDQPSVPLVMLKVLLDKPDSDDEMETWFQRGLKLNADTYPVYLAKRWYLLPQWHGRGWETNVWSFGQACAAGNDWSHKTPLILLQSDHDPVRRNPQFFANGEIWTALESTFRNYLQQFPNSIEYRTFFLDCAVKGGHWKVATEQLALLGNRWDRDILSGEAYARMARDIAEHRDVAEAPSQPAPNLTPPPSPSPDVPSNAPLPPRD